MRLRWLLWGGLVAVALLAGVAVRRPAADPAAAPAAAAAAAPTAALPAHFVGSQACADCHAKEFREYSQGGHGRAEADSSIMFGKVGCESCHGPGSQHVDADGDKSNPGYATVIDPRKLPADKLNAMCVTCHKDGEQFLWENSAHANHKVSCISCHSMHSPTDAGHAALLQKDNTSELCLTCHKTKRLSLARSAHMPLTEGGMSCASCHNPHGSSGPHMIRASSNNELCESCHADKRGPMLWEHAPVRENCLNCHEPHGANNDKVLTGKRPFLCQRCHIGTRHPATLYDAPDLASNRLFNRSCTNCHSQIHGSNDPSGKFLLR